MYVCIWLCSYMFNRENTSPGLAPLVALPRRRQGQPSFAPVVRLLVPFVLHIWTRDGIILGVGESCHGPPSMGFPSMPLVALVELCYSYPCPCQEEFYKLLPAVPISSTHLFYKLSWAWV